MHVGWSVSIVLFLWLVSRKTAMRSTEHPRENTTPTTRVGLTVAGVLLCVILFEAQVSYDDLVSKTKRVVSADAVNSRLANSLGHSILFSLIGRLVSDIATTDDADHSFRLRYPHVLGMLVGFVIATHMVRIQHLRALRGNM